MKRFIMYFIGCLIIVTPFYFLIASAENDYFWLSNINLKDYSFMRFIVIEFGGALMLCVIYVGFLSHHFMQKDMNNEYK